MSALYKKWTVILPLVIFNTAGLLAQVTDPFLRLETGMHNARSSSISTDAQGRYVLSCSDDKTARLWDALTGKLINVLRIPIGENDEGKLFACALSPDAKIVAAAGQTRSEKDTECICIINTFTGEIIKNLCNLPDIVNKLEFSPDGKWLAAALGNGGVRIFNMQTWQEKNLAGDYQDQVYGLSFNNNNKLVTSCFDGYIRLYSLPSFSLIVQTNKLIGKLPYSVAFNSAGNLIAVGYNKQPVTEVLYSDDLHTAYIPDASGAALNEDFSSVSFSADGNALYAGGNYKKLNNEGKLKYVLRKWKDGGEGVYTDLMLLENTIMGIKPLPSGKMALAGTYPDITVINASENTFWYKKALNLNFGLNEPDDFKLSLEADAISVSGNSAEPVFFNIADRSLNQDNAVYYPPVIQSAWLKLTSFKNTTSPSINNNIISFLGKEETCRSACINSSGTRIAWGADFNLYLTDNSGRLVWKTPLPEASFAVNIAAENKTVTVALGDGTIRWYNITSGKELLSLYINKNQQWVLYTPKGYYDASAGAEDLLGWHVNNGFDKAPSFFPVSRFKKFYYRPDIIDALVKKWKEDTLLNYANENSKESSLQAITNERLPPTIVINNPHSGTQVNTEVVTISYTLYTPQNAPVKNIKVLVDGRPVTTDRGIKLPKNGNHNVTVNIPQKACTVTLLAENDYGISPEANLYLQYNTVAGEAGKKSEKKSMLYLLAIGVSEYINPVYKLNYAADDALGFAAAFNNQVGVLYENVIVKCITDKDATRENIEDAFEWIKQQTTGNDVAMIFFAGHGVNDNTGIFYMAPAGADMQRLRTTCVNFSALTQTIATISGKVIVFIDACHSGDVTGGGRYFGDINGVVNELSNSQNGAVVFTSSTGREFSIEDPKWKHGVFTKALLDGLNGAALFEKGETEITIKSLDLYLSRKVKQLTGGKQSPTRVSPPNIPDFTISIIK